MIRASSLHGDMMQLKISSFYVLIHSLMTFSSTPPLECVAELASNNLVSIISSWSSFSFVIGVAVDFVDWDVLRNRLIHLKRSTYEKGSANEISKRRKQEREHSRFSQQKQLSYHIPIASSLFPSHSNPSSFRPLSRILSTPTLNPLLRSCKPIPHATTTRMDFEVVRVLHG